MAPPTGTLRVTPYFGALLALIAILYAVVFWPGQPRTPKLGLDLQGGAQVILKATTIGGKTPTKDSMNQARQIITDRVNSRGVSSAEVVTQGNDRIVVSIPGKGVEDLKDVGETALLEFRPSIVAPDQLPQPQAPAATASPTATGSATPSASVSKSATTKASTTAKPKATTPATTSPAPQGRVVPHLAPTTAPASTPAASTPAATTPAATSAPPSAAPASDDVIDQWKDLGFTPPTTEAMYTALTADQKTKLLQRVQAWDCRSKPLDTPGLPLISCNEAGNQKYLLGPVIVRGTEIKDAMAVAPGSIPGQLAWSISLGLKSKGQTDWANYTSKHNEKTQPGATENLVAFTLDSKVKEASTVQDTISGGDTSITGSFTQSTAKSLATSLKYGALPLSFEPLTNTSVSPTLGVDQLKAGLLAGGIGLALVVIYSLAYYRGLGLVTIASLMVSAGITYAMLVILGKQIGFTLTLAGIAGFIVAVGITADSFVVFFERIKDEVHEGRSARVAIPRAWHRARRTIISADTVSLLAAVTLYYFAAGEVRGFAFTLGLSTAIDLIVVFLFTHPLVSVFSRSAVFGSARFTGLDHVRNPNYVPAEAMAGVASTAAVSGSAAERAAARRGLARNTSTSSPEDES